MELDSLAWIFVMSFSVVGLLTAARRGRLLALTAPAGVMLATLLPIMGNWGLVLRMRLQVLPFVCIAAAVGLSFVINAIRLRLARTRSETSLSVNGNRVSAQPIQEDEIA
jgi:hypothetical protein